MKGHTDIPEKPKKDENVTHNNSLGAQNVKKEDGAKADVKPLPNTSKDTTASMNIVYEHQGGPYIKNMFEKKITQDTTKKFEPVKKVESKETTTSKSNQQVGFG